MRVLHLTLKKKWFDMIASGEKKEEYREIKKYWAVRFCGSARYIGNDKGLLPNDKTTFWNGFYPISFQKPDVVRFVNGGNFHPTHPSFTIKLEEIKIGKGKPEWGAEPGKEYFVIKLGELLPENPDLIKGE